MPYNEIARRFDTLLITQALRKNFPLSITTTVLDGNTLVTVKVMDSSKADFFLRRGPAAPIVHFEGGPRDGERVNFSDFVGVSVRTGGQLVILDDEPLPPPDMNPLYLIHAISGYVFVVPPDHTLQNNRFGAKIYHYKAIPVNKAETQHILALATKATQTRPNNTVLDRIFTYFYPK